MNFFGIGLPEMAVIAAIGLLVFGPKRLPELGRTLGKTLRGFQSASREFEQEFRSAIHSESAEAAPAASSSVTGSPVASNPAASSPVATAQPGIAAGSEAEPTATAAMPLEPGTGG